MYALLFLLLLHLTNGSNIANYTYICIDADQNLCLGISPGKGEASLDSVYRLQLKDRENNEEKGTDYKKTRLDINYDNGTIEMSTGGLFVNKRKSSGVAWVSADYGQFNLSSFLNEDGMGHIQTGEECLTAIECSVKLTSNGNRFCNPDTTTPVKKEEDLKSGLYLKFKECTSEFNQVFRTKLDCAQGCLPSMIGDRHCDGVCFNSNCEFDGGDCNPTAFPTAVPTLFPSVSPTLNPVFTSVSPSSAPSPVPTSVPTLQPSKAPSLAPSFSPSFVPTPEPSAAPTVFSPTRYPTKRPTTLATFSPSSAPTNVSSDVTNAVAISLSLLFVIAVLCCMWCILWPRRRNENETTGDEEDNTDDGNNETEEIGDIETSEEEKEAEENINVEIPHLEEIPLDQEEAEEAEEAEEETEDAIDNATEGEGTIYVSPDGIGRVSKDLFFFQSTKVQKNPNNKSLILKPNDKYRSLLRKKRRDIIASIQNIKTYSTSSNI